MKTKQQLMKLSKSLLVAQIINLENQKQFTAKINEINKERFIENETDLKKLKTLYKKQADRYAKQKIFNEGKEAGLLAAISQLQIVKVEPYE